MGGAGVEEASAHRAEHAQYGGPQADRDGRRLAARLYGGVRVFPRHQLAYARPVRRPALLLPRLVWPASQALCLSLPIVSLAGAGCRVQGRCRGAGGGLEAWRRARARGADLLVLVQALCACSSAWLLRTQLAPGEVTAVWGSSVLPGPLAWAHSGSWTLEARPVSVTVSEHRDARQPLGVMWTFLIYVPPKRMLES